VMIGAGLALLAARNHRRQAPALGRWRTAARRGFG